MEAARDIADSVSGEPICVGPVQEKTEGPAYAQNGNRTGSQAERSYAADFVAVHNLYTRLIRSLRDFGVKTKTVCGNAKCTKELDHDVDFKMLEGWRDAARDLPTVRAANKDLQERVTDLMGVRAKDREQIRGLKDERAQFQKELGAGSPSDLKGDYHTVRGRIVDLERALGRWENVTGVKVPAELKTLPDFTVREYIDLLEKRPTQEELSAVKSQLEDAKFELDLLTEQMAEGAKKAREEREEYDSDIEELYGHIEVADAQVRVRAAIIAEKESELERERARLITIENALSLEKQLTAVLKENLSAVERERNEAREQSNTSAEEDLALMVQKRYGRAFADAAEKFEEVFPRGLSPEVRVCLLTEFEYVLKEVPAILKSGLNVTDSGSIDALLEELSQAGCAFEESEGYRAQRTQYLEANAFVMAYGHEVEDKTAPQEVIDLYDEHKQFLEHYEAERDAWVTRRERIPGLIKQVKRARESYGEKRQGANALNGSALQVGLYTYAFGSDAGYRVCFLLPVKKDNNGRMLTQEAMLAVCEALLERGVELSTVDVRDAKRVDLKYGLSARPSAEQVKMLLDETGKYLAEKSMLSKAGVTFKITNFGEI